MLAHDTQGMRKRTSAGACGGANGPLTIEDTACCGGSGFAINAFQETQIQDQSKSYERLSSFGDQNPRTCDSPLRETFVI